MFIQVIQGHVTDRDEIRKALDTWGRDLAGEAPGWLGTTAGLTADDMLIALARFDSIEHARDNSARPEQHRWWMETSKLFAGDVMVHDCTEIDTYLGGGSDDAGFVQVIQGRVSDPERVRDLNRRSEGALATHRPEIIGGTVAYHGDGGFTEVVYFTSEAAAREGERRELPPELAAFMDQWRSLLSDVRYYDLTEPWLYSPAR